MAVPASALNQHLHGSIGWTNAPTYLQWRHSQIEDIPCHSSRGGAVGEPRGREELYAALNLSYCSRAPEMSSAARAASITCALCALQHEPGKSRGGRWRVESYRVPPRTTIIVTSMSHQKLNITSKIGAAFKHVSNSKQRDLGAFVAIAGSSIPPPLATNTTIVKVKHKYHELQGMTSAACLMTNTSTKTITSQWGRIGLHHPQPKA